MTENDLNSMQEHSANGNDELDDLLKRGVSSLERYEPSPALWQRIEQQIQAGQSRPSLIRRFIELLDKIFPADIRYLRPVTAGIGILLVIAAVFYTGRSFTVSGKIGLQNEALSEIAMAEKHYINAIEKLTVMAESNQDNIDSNLLALYNEKIQYIDNSIDECRRILQENNLNHNAWVSLFAFYQKKVDTLSLLAGFETPTKPKGIM